MGPRPGAASAASWLAALGLVTLAVTLPPPAQPQHTSHGSRPSPDSRASEDGESAGVRAQEDLDLLGAVSERSLERIRYDCRTEIDRRDVTLFANGTLRLRQGEPGKESMWLVELRPEERDAYLARLRADNREEAEPDVATVAGDWIARCRLAIHLPGSLPEEFRLGRFDSLSLGLQRAVALAEELVARVDTSTPPEGTTRLPVGYRPEVGDELRRPDGAWFRVEGYTAEGGGVELSGLDQPLVLYIATDNLGREFVELRRRERSGR